MNFGFCRECNKPRILLIDKQNPTIGICLDCTNELLALFGSFITTDEIKANMPFFVLRFRL